MNEFLTGLVNLKKLLPNSFTPIYRRETLSLDGVIEAVFEAYFRDLDAHNASMQTFSKAVHAVWIAQRT